VERLTEGFLETRVAPGLQRDERAGEQRHEKRERDHWFAGAGLFAP